MAHPVLHAQVVKRDFCYDADIARGADGAVKRYRHKRIPTQCIAIKIPLEPSRDANTGLALELSVMKQLRCEKIVTLLGHDDDWQPFGPALFYELCDLGDATHYFSKLNRQYRGIPEAAIWQLFSNMATALNYCHNQMQAPLIHGDFKPANILVCRPRGSHDTLPVLPDFKLADFGRAKTYIAESPTEFWGTTEFGPNLDEQSFGQSPATDIWSLGATLQSVALQILPTQSKASFLAEKNRQRRRPLDRAALELFEWRKQIPVVYRPLDVSPGEMVSRWDWPEPHRRPPQYSSSLNRWYSMCLTKDMSKRITAEYLVTYLVPVAMGQIAVLSAGNRSGILPRGPPTIPPRPEKYRQRNKQQSESRGPGPPQPKYIAYNPAMHGHDPRNPRHIAKQGMSPKASPPRREDYGLPPRRPRNQGGQEDPNYSSGELQKKEAKYLRGMKKR